jgi:hypothetical protein
MDAGDWVAAGAAAVAVVALIFTAVQARAAKDQANAAREQVQVARRQTEVQEQLYRDQQQPYVWLDYRIDPISYWLVDLVIKNEGPTTAQNVKIDIDPMIGRSKHFGDKELANLPGFLEGFSALPPGREMRWSLGSHTDIFEQGALGRHTITISLEGPFGSVEPYSYVLDYDDMRESALRDPGHIGQVAKELKEIKKTFEKGVSVVQGMAGEQ